MRRTTGVLAGAILGMVLALPASAEIKIGVTPSLTGLIAFAGEGTRLTMEVAVADLNAAGGVLGERLRIVMVDDQCEADAAVLAAGKLVAEQVAVVFGHLCSAAAIPASGVYEAAGIPMFAGYGTNPKLTERGLRYVFRLMGRNDRQAVVAAGLLAARYRDVPIAMVHDTQEVHISLAADVQKELHLRGIKEALYEELSAGQMECADLIGRFRQANVAVLYCNCYVEQGGLLVRQLWESGLKIPIVGSNTLGVEDYWIVAGAEAAQATVLTDAPNWLLIPETGPAAARMRDAGTDPLLYGQFQLYAGLQAWAQAVEQVKSARGADVVPVLRKERFDTVLGTIGFNEKGEIAGPVDWVWFRWRDGKLWEVLTEELHSGRVVEKPGQNQ